MSRVTCHTLHFTPHVLHLTPNINTPFLFKTLHILHLKSYTLHLTPSILHLKSYILHLTPYISHVILHVGLDDEAQAEAGLGVGGWGLGVGDWGLEVGGYEWALGFGHDCFRFMNRFLVHERKPSRWSVL